MAKRKDKLDTELDVLQKKLEANSAAKAKEQKRNKIEGTILAIFFGLLIVIGILTRDWGYAILALVTTLTRIEANTHKHFGISFQYISENLIDIMDTIIPEEKSYREKR